MRVITIKDEDFVNYHEPVMFIGTIQCGGKCCIEAGIPLSVCQNDTWRGTPPLDMSDEKIIKRYSNNLITKGIVFGGLEPFEQYDELKTFISCLRNSFQNNDPVIIYTGYDKDEISAQITELAANFTNIIVKFGRYVPGQEKHYDEVLGVSLASPNQYAEKIC